MESDTLIISIGGGKGGVGKSMVSANLAVKFAEAGLRVILIDLDFGAANLHTIFGMRKAPKGLGQYLTIPRSQLKDFLVPSSVEGLQLIACSGFVPEMANLKHVQKVKLIRQIKELDADLILLDLGAGSSNNVVDFFSMSHAGIVVTTPEPTAVVNSYEFLKNVLYRVLFRMFKNNPEVTKLLKMAATPENRLGIESIEDLLGHIRKINPWTARNVEDVCQDMNFHLVFNQARHAGQASLGQKLRGICQKYLSIDLNFSGMIYHDPEVSHSVFKMQPLSRLYPDSVASKSLGRIAKQIFTQVAKGVLSEDAHESFDEQFKRVKRQAKKDFTENLLSQKRSERARSDYNTEDITI